MQKKEAACYITKNPSSKKVISPSTLQPSFLKKDGLKTFPAPSTERCGITQSKRDNIVNTLKGVPQSVHSFWNSISCNNTSPDLCCSRDALEEEKC